MKNGMKGKRKEAKKEKNLMLKFHIKYGINE